MVQTVCTASIGLDDIQTPSWFYGKVLASFRGSAPHPFDFLGGRFLVDPKDSVVEVPVNVLNLQANSGGFERHTACLLQTGSYISPRNGSNERSDAWMTRFEVSRLFSSTPASAL